MRVFARSLVVAIVCALAAPAWSADSKADDEQRQKILRRCEPETAIGRDGKQRYGRRTEDRLQGGRRHDHPHRQGREQGRPDREHVLRGVFQAQRKRREAADHVFLQRRSGFVDGVAAHGRVRSQARGHAGRSAHAGGAVQHRQQQFQPARCDRSRLHRCAGHRFFAPAFGREGQGKTRKAAHRTQEGFLRRRSGRPGVRAIHRQIPHAIPALEFAEVSVRRKLRHHAFGGAREHSGDAGKRRSQRRDPVVADSVASATTSTRRSSIRASIRPMRSRCRRMRRARGITIACRISRRI